MGATTLTDLILTELPQENGVYNLRRCRIRERIRFCRTEHLGGRILECQKCGSHMVVYNPCHQRGCPQCAGMVRAQWRHRMQKRLLETGHMHITFSAPKELTDAWRSKPREVIESLFAAVSRTCKLEVARSGLKLGFVLVFHSHGKGLSYKAHMHALVTAGGLGENHRWKEYRRFREEVLREDFRRLLTDEVSRRLSADQALQIRDAPADSWRVYSVYRSEPPDALIGYFSRTVHGVVVDPDDEFFLEDNGTVRITSNHHGEKQTTVLDVEEFLTRYFAHIPPRATVTVRHYGLYATRHAAWLREARSIVKPSSQEERKQMPEEPLHICPLCKSGMKPVTKFDGKTLPEELAAVKRARGSPCEHGELIQPKEASA